MDAGKNLRVIWPQLYFGQIGAYDMTVRPADGEVLALTRINEFITILGRTERGIAYTLPSDLSHARWYPWDGSGKSVELPAMLPFSGSYDYGLSAVHGAGKWLAFDWDLPRAARHATWFLNTENPAYQFKADGSGAFDGERAVVKGPSRLARYDLATKAGTAYSASYGEMMCGEFRMLDQWVAGTTQYVLWGMRPGNWPRGYQPFTQVDAYDAASGKWLGGQVLAAATYDRRETPYYIEFTQAGHVGGTALVADSSGLHAYAPVAAPGSGEPSRAAAAPPAAVAYRAALPPRLDGTLAGLVPPDAMPG